MDFYVYWNDSCLHKSISYIWSDHILLSWSQRWENESSWRWLVPSNLRRHCFLIYIYIHVCLLSLNTVGAHRTRLICRYLRARQIYLSYRFDFFRLCFNILKANFLFFIFFKRLIAYVMSNILKLKLQVKYQILWRLAQILYQPITSSPPYVSVDVLYFTRFLMSKPLQSVLLIHCWV